MFHSQSLLSRKGPLGNIWIAAYCLKKLKRQQIDDTDIISSIGMIPHLGFCYFWIFHCFFTQICWGVFPLEEMVMCMLMGFMHTVTGCPPKYTITLQCALQWVYFEEIVMCLLMVLFTNGFSPSLTIILRCPL